ncbi:hypothetical protein [Phycicoccus sp.]|uniref:hypothetical protein n=1 Tax=Phycicoccus sp. TaxID=1902410 RepID=UPI002B61BEED|nr:hypothetical protein [Phycicoccus sp.]HMM95296.1 hypothetical protein [Phycicoccus sp.]
MTPRTFRVTLEPITHRPFTPATVEDLGKRNQPKLLIAHDWSQPIGRVVSVVTAELRPDGRIDAELTATFNPRLDAEQVEEYIELLTARPAEWGGHRESSPDRHIRIVEICPATEPPASPVAGPTLSGTETPPPVAVPDSPRHYAQRDFIPIAIWRDDPAALDAFLTMSERQILNDGVQLDGLTRQVATFLRYEPPADNDGPASRFVSCRQEDATLVALHREWRLAPGSPP